jgi:hypothetical protein
MNKFDSYCEIVAKRIEYEKGISKWLQCKRTLATWSE